MLAESVATFMKSLGGEVIIVSVFDYKLEDLHNITHLFLGCWTRVRFLKGQCPQKEWIQVIESIDYSRFCHVILFTTYNIVKGTMYKSVLKHIHPKPFNTVPFQNPERVDCPMNKKLYFPNFSIFLKLALFF